MNRSESRYSHSLREFDRLCDEFEASLADGHAPMIDDFLGRVDPSLQRRLFRELFTLESEKAIADGLPLKPGESLLRYPAFAQIVNEVISDLGRHTTAMLQPSAEKERTGSFAPKTGSEVEQYLLLELIGMGGMGRVYRAHDRKLNRNVAIKFMRDDIRQESSAYERFVREAESVASLQHDNIVRIYDIGEYAGSIFLTFEFIEGKTLTKWLDGRPLPARQCATILRQVASAISAAHDQGVIHRDLKPGNVLLTPDGSVKVTDFGLAKRHDTQKEITAGGEMLGTAAYMAPEQIHAAQLTNLQTDVYGLGAILYEMLTGRSPFIGEGQWEIVQQVINNDPVPPRLVNPLASIDLQTICLKCLDKEPRRRYQSVFHVEQELDRYLEGHPIEARPGGWMQRAGKWVKRNRAIATTISLSVVVLTLAVAIWISQVSSERNRFRSQRDLAQQHLAESLIQNAQLQLQSKPPGWWFSAQDNLEKAVEVCRHQGLSRDQLREAAIEWMGTSDPCFLKTHELSTGKEPVAVSIGNNGKWVVVARKDEIRICSIEDLSTIATLKLPFVCSKCVAHPSNALLIAVSEASGIFLTSPRIDLGRAESSQLQTAPLEIEWQSLDISAPLFAAFSNSGRWLAVACENGEVQLFEGNYLKKPSFVFELGARPSCLAFGGRDIELLVGDTRPRFTRFELTNGNMQAEKALEVVAVSAAIGNTNDSFLEPHIIWTIEDTFGLVRHNLDTLESEQATPNLHHRTIQKVLRRGFDLVFTGSLDGDIGVFGVGNLQRVALARHSGGEVRDFDVDLQGRTMVAGLSDGTLTRWELHRSPFVTVFENAASQAALSADGDRLWMASYGIDLLDLDDPSPRPAVRRLIHRREASQLPGEDRGTDDTNFIWDVDTNSDDSLMVTASHNGAVCIWDTESFRIQAVHQIRQLAWCVEFSPGNRFIAAGGDELKLIDLTTGEERTLTGHSEFVFDICFSADAQFLFSCSRDGTLRAWDVATGDPVGILLQSANAIYSVAVSSDDRQVVAGLYDGHLAICDSHASVTAALESGDGRWEWHEQPLHQSQVRAVRYSPDGTLLASGSDRGRVILLDAKSHSVLGELRTGSGEIRDIEFSRDMNRLAIASYARPTYVWDFQKVLAQLENWGLAW